MTTLPTDMHANSLRFNWRYHSSHVGDDGPAATHTYRLGSVDATPGVGDDGIAATHTGRLGSVDATTCLRPGPAPSGASDSCFCCSGR